jgi:hypothetical protein
MRWDLDTLGAPVEVAFGDVSHRLNIVIHLIFWATNGWIGCLILRYANLGKMSNCMALKRLRAAPEGARRRRVRATNAAEMAKWNEAVSQRRDPPHAL